MTGLTVYTLASLLISSFALGMAVSTLIHTLRNK